MSGMEHPWEESRGMGFSYGYNRAERLEHYHSGRELVILLADIVSRGGCWTSVPPQTEAFR